MTLSAKVKLQRAVGRHAVRESWAWSREKYREAEIGRLKTVARVLAGHATSLVHSRDAKARDVEHLYTKGHALVAALQKLDSIPALGAAVLGRRAQAANDNVRSAIEHDAARTHEKWIKARNTLEFLQARAAAAIERQEIAESNIERAEDEHEALSHSARASVHMCEQDVVALQSRVFDAEALSEREALVKGGFIYTSTPERAEWERQYKNEKDPAVRREGALQLEHAKCKKYGVQRLPALHSPAEYEAWHELFVAARTRYVESAEFGEIARKEMLLARAEEALQAEPEPRPEPTPARTWAEEKAHAQALWEAGEAGAGKQTEPAQVEEDDFIVDP